MILRSFGCSFIFGTDLSDDGRHSRYATPSQHTWPALTAKYQNAQYQCHARPGSGNLQILERILNQACVEILPAFYIIGWSWIDRFDYIYTGYDRWKTVMPIDSDSVAVNYYKNLHSQYRDKLTNLIYIKTAIDTLQQCKIPFVMTHMDNLLFETDWHAEPGIKHLQNYIRPHIKTFENKTFLDWSKEKGFEISPTLHPLEAAHAAAAEYAINHFLV